VRHRIAPNIVLGIAAALLDMQFSQCEIGPMSTVLFQHMFTANAVEGAQQSSSVLRELPDECVCYIGQPSRVSPRKRRGATGLPGVGESGIVEYSGAQSAAKLGQVK